MTMGDYDNFAMTLLQSGREDDECAVLDQTRDLLARLSV